MPLLAGDIRFARSANMADVPEGGGPPSAQLLTSGRSNEIFPDVSEETRTVGRVEIYQIFGLLRNLDRDPLLGANVIIAEPPADPNVSITMLSLKNPFATRADIARRIESGMSAGSEWSGYLLENHFATMRSIQLLQRPGAPKPTVGKTYVLVYQEGQSGERRQRVRVKSVDTQDRIFSQIVNGTLTDFTAQVSTCELFDALLYDFPGSAPSRLFARETDKTRVRETIYTDSGMFYGAARLTVASQITDNWLQLTGIYTQIVPNSRTEAAAIDQQPAAGRTLVLAETPRRIEVGITPHTQRLRIGEENVGLVFVFQCRPYPSPGTLILSYRTMGTWYTLQDNGQGVFEGSGAGTVNYLTGSLAVTLKSVPDIGSSLVLSWGENTAFTNRAGSAAFRPPEYGWQLPDKPIKPGSLTISWPSGGVTYSVTDNGTGALAGTGGAGNVSYATGQVFVRPSKLPDAGGELSAAYTYREERVEIFPGVVPDAGGFATLTLAEVPAPRSVALEWTTVRNVSVSSGSTEVVSESKTQVGVSEEGKVIVSTAPRAWTLALASGTAAPGNTVTMRFETPGAAHVGTYTWTGDAAKMSPASGTFAVAAHGSEPNTVYYGTFDVTLAAGAQGNASFVVKDDAASVRATGSVYLYADTTLPPADFERLPSGEVRAITGAALGGYTAAGVLVRVVLQPLYQDGVGWVYDPPARSDAQWSDFELLAGKALLSRRGASTEYKAIP